MALIRCPECDREVSTSAMKCAGCGCTLRVRVRGFFGKLFKWLLILWCLVMLAWAIAGVIGAQQIAVHDQAERAGRALGTAIGIYFIAWVWFWGALFLGLLVFLSRPGETSPSVAVHPLRPRSPMPAAGRSLDEPPMAVAPDGTRDTPQEGTPAIVTAATVHGVGQGMVNANVRRGRWRLEFWIAPAIGTALGIVAWYAVLGHETAEQPNAAQTTSSRQANRDADRALPPAPPRPVCNANGRVGSCTNLNECHGQHAVGFCDGPDEIVCCLNEPAPVVDCISPRLNHVPRPAGDIPATIGSACCRRTSGAGQTAGEPRCAT